jgi:hypothetical protein
MNLYTWERIPDFINHIKNRLYPEYPKSSPEKYCLLQKYFALSYIYTILPGTWDMNMVVTTNPVGRHGNMR